MDLHEAIYQRRSVRRYTDRQVQPATVSQLLDAAVQAPSALNQQPWAFGVYHGRKLLQDYSNRAKAHLVATLHPLFEIQLRSQLYENPDYDLFHGAGTVVVIYATRGRLNPTEDCCLSAQNLMLAAHGAGLGTCPIGFARPWFDLSEIKRELGISGNYTAVFPLAVGYPAESPGPVQRNAPEIVSWMWRDDGNSGHQATR